VRDAGVRVFKAIPFAAPPVGALRWRPPQPVSGWTGVRNAKQFAPVCQQPARTGFAAAVGSGVRLGPSSEDCLYLNVWTAATSSGALLPVMVWFPGGGFATGGGSGLVFDGEALARKSIVVVTANYRLGVLGFFAHPELTNESERHVSGDYGLLDQVEVLQWVKRNITAFGGNPGNVTIFGQSAGATSVSYLMASPLAKGLFHRVIGESGGGTGGTFSLDATVKLKEAEQAGLRSAESLGAKSISELRSWRADDLVQRVEGTGPIVDGWFMPADVSAIYRSGKQNDVPLLVGSNADDSDGARAISSDEYIVRSRARYGALFDSYIRFYPGSTQEDIRFLNGDTQAWRVLTWARQHAKTGRFNAYLYYFARRAPPNSPGGNRAYHGAELYYVFSNLHLFNQDWSEWDWTLENIISSYWVNFAFSGDPNGGMLPHWSPYMATESDRVMTLGDKVEMGRSRLDQAKINLFDAYYDQMLSH
jgi:para-nitrobenzyl esterase